MSHLVATDGSLLFTVEFIPRLINNPSNRNNPKNILKSYMYHLRWKISREGYTFTYPLRARGMTGNRLFNRTPSTKMAKTQLGRWIVTELIILNHATFVNQGSCNGSLFFLRL